MAGMVDIHAFRLEWRGNSEFQQLVPVAYDKEGKELPIRRRRIKKFLKRLKKVKRGV